MYKTASLTGHRPGGFTPSQQTILKEELVRVIHKLSPNVAISGMAMGADMWWAETALYNDVPFHAYLPGIDQTKGWVEEDKVLWGKLVDQAKEVYLAGVSEILTPVPGAKKARTSVMKREYSDHTVSTPAYHARNRAMVDNSDITVVCWNGHKGGTSTTFDYIRSINQPYILIDFTVDPTKATTTISKGSCE